MTNTSHRVSLLSAGALTILLVAVFTLRTHLAAAIDCVGRPYGFPGCPTRPVSSLSASSGPNMCGNAIVDPGEECDKGRFNGKTDCSTDCKTLFCGDGILSRDLGEECEPKTEEVYVEDKNGNLTTEIRFSGVSQCGWYCEAPACAAAGKCDGGCTLRYVDSCTATGSTVSSSAATSVVTLNAAASASSAALPAIAPAVCGNGVVDKGEECDDGNKNPVDACGNDCRLPSCGDGIVQKGEECEDGNKENADACTNLCTLPRCGDNIVQGREECDDGALNADKSPNTCRTNCLEPHCGDGITDTDEQCDAGAQNSDALPNACRVTCRLAVCGDGVRDATEQCDDGNRDDTDACTTSCTAAACGDGVVQAGEECDWGAKNAAEAPDACRMTCKLPRCGDGIVDTGERCDGAGCSADCRGLDTSAAMLQAASSSSRKSAAKLAAPVRRVAGSVPVLGIAIGVAGVLFMLTVLLLRQRIVGLFHGGKGAKSIDDIPLDQIEMPWHRW